MKLAAIHHVAIIVSDYEKAREFYVNKLGFAVVRENFRKERNDWKLDLRVGDGADAIDLETIRTAGANRENYRGAIPALSCD